MTDISAPKRKNRTPVVNGRLLLRRFGTLLGFMVIVMIFGYLRPTTFLSVRNWLNISQQVSILGVIAFASTVVMAVGDFDLSVGAMASLSGIVAARLVEVGQPTLIAMIAAVAIGALGGGLNGLLVSYIRISAFVATLGTLTMFAGLALLVSDGKTIFGSVVADAFGGFARGGIPLGEINGRLTTFPNLTILSLVILFIIWLVLEQTIFGRRVYAVGGNYEASRLGGLPVRTIRLSTFVMSGVGAAIAGLMLVSRLETANPTQGDGLMLQAIAAVFLGMTMSEEGEPHVLGTFVGVLILGVLANGLRLLSVDSFIQQVLTGFIIILAVALSRLGHRD